jgi:hypothetical protein
MQTYQFFGYGVLSDRYIIKEIIGRDPGVGKSAVVEGYQLAYQVLDQIPLQIRPFLEKVWGSAFRAYTLRGGAGVVSGRIWELTDAELIRIREWNFVGTWRELGETSAKTSTGEVIRVTIEKVADSQPITEVVDGISYEANLNYQGQRIIAEQSREEELELVREQLIQLRRVYEKPIAASS